MWNMHEVRPEEAEDVVQVHSADPVDMVTGAHPVPITQVVAETKDQACHTLRSMVRLATQSTGSSSKI